MYYKGIDNWKANARLREWIRRGRAAAVLHGGKNYVVVGTGVASTITQQRSGGWTHATLRGTCGRSSFPSYTRREIM